MRFKLPQATQNSSACRIWPPGLECDTCGVWWQPESGKICKLGDRLVWVTLYDSSSFLFNELLQLLSLALACLSANTSVSETVNALHLVLFCPWHFGWTTNTCWFDLKCCRSPADVVRMYHFPLVIKSSFCCLFLLLCDREHLRNIRLSFFKNHVTVILFRYTLLTNTRYYLPDIFHIHIKIFMNLMQSQRCYREPPWHRQPFNKSARAFVLQISWWQSRVTSTLHPPRLNTLTETSIRLNLVKTNVIFLDLEETVVQSDVELGFPPSLLWQRSELLKQFSAVC